MRRLVCVLVIAAFVFVPILALATTLRWSPVESTEDCTIDGYKVHYGTDSSNLTNVVDVGDVTSYVIDPILVANTTMYFAVSAYSTANLDGPLSSPVPYRKTVVPEVQDVTGFNDGETLSVSWTADPSLTYKVYYGVNSGQYLWNKVTSVGDSYIELDTFLLGYPVYAKVVVIMDGKESLTADMITIYPYTGPGEVQDVLAVNDGSSITITWTPEEFYSYRVYYGTSAGVYSGYVDTTVGDAEAELPDELIGETVFFKVVPLDEGVEGLLSSEVTVNPYLGVRNVQAYDNGSSIVITYDLLPGATGYIIRRAYFADMSWATVIHEAEADQNSFSFMRFPGNITYYTVTALDANGYEINEYNIMTVEPFNPSCEIRKDSSGNLYAIWTGQDGVGSFEIHYGFFGVCPYSLPTVDGAETSTPLNTAFNTTTYELSIEVVALEEDGVTPRWEASFSAIPANLTPDP